ncbi:MAG TPA: hypothetical protein DDW50_16000 [Firmicutes bacterium]|jgi:hypothetical protein|nr:hypothetical protein [Bacillota bacterium]
MKFIPPGSQEFIAAVRSSIGAPLDLVFETLSEGHITVAYLSSITDANQLQDNILGPLGTIIGEQPLRNNRHLEMILQAVRERGRTVRTNFEDIIDDLMAGRTLIHILGHTEAYSFETSKRAKRLPTDANVERTVRGVRITFVEDFDDNISMIRSWVQDPSLRIEGMRIGRRSRTRVAVMYLEDVADPGLVEEVRRRLGRIDIDSVLDSGYIEQLITDNRWSIFPLTQATERPDKVAAAIFEGRVVIDVSGSQNVIIVPVTINDLYQSPEDYYWGFWFGSFLRFLRILGNNIAVALPGLYIALLGVNPEVLPVQFALTISGSRMGVALPLVIELLLIEITLEIFREASLRLPQTVSQTLGVTTGIVLGIAAVGAGIVSNATLVVTVITAIASYSGPDYGISLTWRILKYFLIFAAASFGLIGLVAAGLAILCFAAAQNSFGVGFLSPWTPIRGVELLDTILRRPLWFPRRAGTYHPTDKIRLGWQKKGAPDPGHGKREDE